MIAARVRAELCAGGCTEEEIALFLRVQGIVRRRALARMLRAVCAALARLVAAA